MKEKRECKIIQDLLPNYVEKLTNEETNKYIEEHLSSCEECKKVLEDMKKDIKIATPKIEDREIKYFKKYNRKLKLLGAILGIILIIFVLIVARRVVIISILQNKEMASFNKDNYYARMYSHAGGNLNVIETYYKDGEYLTNITNLTEDKGDIKQSKLITYYKDNAETYTYIESESGKYAMPNTGINQIVTGHLGGYSKLEIVMMSIISSVKSVECNGIDCYLIEMEGAKQYIDKETGLAVKVLDGKSVINDEVFDRVVDYKYEFGKVTDDNLKAPDISEYEIVEN